MYIFVFESQIFVFDLNFKYNICILFVFDKSYLTPTLFTTYHLSCKASPWIPVENVHLTCRRPGGIVGIQGSRNFQKSGLRASHTRILVALISCPPAHLKSNFQNCLAPQHVFSNKKLFPVRLRITCPNEELLCSY